MCVRGREGRVQFALSEVAFLGEAGLLPDIGVHELLYGVAYGEIVNAAFTLAAPGGGRFNSARRGAWYAALERETSVAEVAFHKIEQLKDVDWKLEETPLTTITSPSLWRTFTIFVVRVRDFENASEPVRYLNVIETLKSWLWI